jgi:CRP/FNR family transcriptional regulator, cyclic AMP receptor protein
LTALPSIALTTPRARVTGVRLLTAGDEIITGRFTRAADAPAPARVGLFDVDRDFADVVPEQDHALARSTLRLPRLSLGAGQWQGPPPRDGDGPPAGLLVLDGLVSQTVTLGGRASIELFGPGDFIGCGDLAPGADDGEVSWSIHQPSSLAFLDERFALAAARWPALWHVVLRRSALRGHRLAAHLAALQLSRIDDRLEAVLWQLAGRWGRVTPDGVVVPLTLTHELLGRLTAAKRPTVSVALAALADSGAVTRRSDGSWLLVRK